MHIEAFFDAGTSTFSYLVLDPDSKRCVLIDSVLDYDPKSGRTRTTNADRLITRVQELGATVDWILETHAHADHLSAAPYLQQKLGGKIGIGDNITVVQETFGKIFNEGAEFQRDGSQFDRLFADGDSYQIGTMTAYALHTPGHTPACMTHVIGNAAFVGDTLFMPDSGSARADFPGGDARTLYRSVRKVLSLPEATRLFMCHDYPDGRAEAWETTVREERDHNVHVNDHISEDQFVAMREARDRTLDMPRLILPSLQVNMRAGHLPPANSEGQVFLKLPVNVL